MSKIFLSQNGPNKTGVLGEIEVPTLTGTDTLTNKTLTTPVLNAPTFSASPTGDSTPQWTSVSLTNAEMLALRAAPKEIIAAPGAGKMIEVLSAKLIFDYTAAYTESADNMGLLWGAAGTAIATIESTGFLTATADTVTFPTFSAASNIALTAVDNKSVVLHNTGDGEFGGGDAANAVIVKVLFRIVPTA